jgi:KilA-N domain
MAKTIIVKGTEIAIVSQRNEDYISLTDMTKAFDDGEQLVKNWLQNKNTIEFLSVWEKLNNPSFNLVEFHQIKIEAGLNRFIMSAKKWIEKTGGVGLIAKAGRYGGTYAHKDIAFEFGSWLSPEFKLYLIKEFQRLKDQENDRLKLDWQFNRTLTKLNYRIHTDAIKAKLIPPLISKQQIHLIYASEADVLNKALFGLTAKEWRDANPQNDGNVRDYASTEQLVVLVNLENLNAMLIQQNLGQSERLKTLNGIAISQMISLTQNPTIKKLK